MTIAIHYSAVRQAPKAGQVYGLQVAVLDWLRAWMHYARQEKLAFLIADEAAQREVLAIARESGIDPQRLAFLDARFPRENLKGIDTIFRADSDPHDLFWQRDLAGAPFSFCGLAHAMTGREAAAALEQFLLAPTSSRDAILCPSKAVASVIARTWEHLGAFYEKRLGRALPCAAQLPVLPLGVDTARIASRVTPDKRAAQRKALGVADDAIVLLWVGRLSHAIKAHPLAMFRAAELAAKQTGRDVHLVMQGYFVPEEAKLSFAALAQDVCPTAKVHFVASDDRRYPDGLWAAGDIFLSLVDNMQESFGLTPVEAIAAGLPRVLSDWDGYRDGVTHGVDGFLVPTAQPPAGAGADLAATLLGERESYGGYLALTAQCVAVDAEAAAKAIAALIEDPALRARIAEAAKKRLPDYDWARLIPAYEEMWAGLREGKQVAEKPASVGAPPEPLLHPHAGDPFFLFESYPSERLSLTTRVTIAASPDEMQKTMAHQINTLASGFMIPSAEIPKFLGVTAQQRTLSLGELFSFWPEAARPALWRTTAWFLKLGFLRLVRD